MSADFMLLGKHGPKISRLGMGCWAIGGHGWGKVNDDDSMRAVRQAVEGGITFFDTADTYGLGKSERLLAEALGEDRKDIVIATKGGVRWNDSGKVWTDISPAYLREAVENSLTRLRIDCIPLYYIHKPDGTTPIRESVAALEKLREEGKIGAMGLANITSSQLLEGLEVASIAAVQVRFNIFDKDNIQDLLHICESNDISLVAWGVLADGLLTGKFTPDTVFSEDDHRSRMSDFVGDVFRKNLQIVDSLNQFAHAKKVKLCQLAIRWVLDYSKRTCALFGAKTDKQVIENFGANGWKLSEYDMAVIDHIVQSSK